MAPQTQIPVAANVLGTIGTILWTVQLVPQIWTNWRTKKTDGLPGIMLVLWASAGVFFGAYAIIQNFNIPIQVQPQGIIFFSLITYTQTLIYQDKWRTWTATLVGVGMMVLYGAIEVALVYGIKPKYEAGDESGVVVTGILASVLVAVGLLPPYGEIWQRKGRVIGINWVFLSMDWVGSFVSLLALAAQNTFDVLGGVLYIIVCLLEIGIFSSHVIWLLRTRKLRKAAALEGKTFDDIATEHKITGRPFKFAERSAISFRMPFPRRKRADMESNFRFDDQEELNRIRATTAKSDGASMVDLRV